MSGPTGRHVRATARARNVARRGCRGARAGRRGRGRRRGGGARGRRIGDRAGRVVRGGRGGRRRRGDRAGASVAAVRSGRQPPEPGRGGKPRHGCPDGESPEALGRAGPGGLAPADRIVHGCSLGAVTFRIDDGRGSGGCAGVAASLRCGYPTQPTYGARSRPLRRLNARARDAPPGIGGSAMATVTFENVNKLYGDFQAVKDLNLEIGDGEFMVLVGPSGCGKTTSLRMIAGLEEISSGTLRIGDRVVNDVPPKDRDIAMVFQSYALYPHMSVRENLAFGLKPRKVPQAEIERPCNT